MGGTPVISRRIPTVLAHGVSLVTCTVLQYFTLQDLIQSNGLDFAMGRLIKGVMHKDQISKLSRSHVQYCTREGNFEAKYND